MGRLFFILLSVALAGCATGPLSANRDLESGGKQEGSVVTCNGYKTWGDCERSASKTCPNGYEVLSKEENIAVQGRTLRVKCK